MEVERKAQIEGGVAVHPEFSRAVREQLPPPTVVPFPKSPPSLLLPWVSPRLSACLPPTRVHTPALPRPPITLSDHSQCADQDDRGADLHSWARRKRVVTCPSPPGWTGAVVTQNMTTAPATTRITTGHIPLSRRKTNPF